MVWPVIDAEHDDRAHIRPELIWIAAALGMARQPVHVAVAAFGQEMLQSVPRLRNGIGRGDTERIEAMPERFRLQRGLDRTGVAQKSRST
ncbi:MAG: hypothetical protein BroJett024_06480 [Alphaproteobacteria bacterium]|nr:MAG: hypothetical protein BroJett024_06480 [Alphaproteobacteria bacterium]